MVTRTRSVTGRILGTRPRPRGVRSISMATGREGLQPASPVADTEVYGWGGITVSGGLLGSLEWNPELRGLEGLKTLRQMLYSDPMVGAVQRAKVLPLLSAAWSFEPADDSSEAGDMADFCNAALMQGMDVTWHQWLEEALDVEGYGFYDFEMIWDTSSGTEVKLESLAARPPLHVEEVLAGADGSFAGIRQVLNSTGMGQGQVYGTAFENLDVNSLSGQRVGVIDIPATKLLHLVRSRRGNDHRGVSGYRTAYKPWFIKKELEVIAAIGYERRANGVDVAKVMPDSDNGTVSQERVDAVFEQLLGLHSREHQAFVEVPGLEYRIEGLSGGTLDPQEFLAYLDTSIARASLAEFLAMGQGEGARSVAEDKSSFFLQALVGMGRVITDGVNRQLVPDLMRFNFPDAPSELYPTLRHDRLDRRQVSEVTAAVGQIVDADLMGPITDDVRNAMRSLVELPEIAERDEDVPDDVERERPDGAPGPDGEGKESPIKVSEGAFSAGQMASASAIVRDVTTGALPLVAGQNQLVILLRISTAEAAAMLEGIEDGFDPGGALPPPAPQGPQGPGPPQAAEDEAPERRPGMDPMSEHEDDDEDEVPDLPTFAERTCSCCTGDGHELRSKAWKIRRSTNRHPVEKFVDFEDITDALDSGIVAVMDAAHAIQEKQVEKMVAKAKRLWARGRRAELLRQDVPLVDDVAEAFAEELKDIAREGQSQADSEMSRQSDGTAQIAITFAIPPIDPEKANQIARYLEARGVAMSKIMEKQMQSAYANTLLPMVRDGDLDTVLLQAQMEGLALREVRKTAGLSVSEAFSLGRKNAQMAFEDLGQVDYYVYSAVADTGTCDPCLALDGEEIPVGSSNFADYYPPLRNGPLGACEGAEQCRCDMIAVFKTGQ